MKKKITCKNCSHEFIPATDVQPVMCPSCNAPAAGVVAMAHAALPDIDAGDPLPEHIQVFPPGKGIKFTLQDYPGQQFEIDVDASVAARANAELQAMIARAAACEGSKPFADENHQDGAKTFEPRQFFWAGDDHKEGGVRLRGDWTPFGAQLVRAKAYGYFSANFLFSKAKKKFIGLINENVGGLVNRPGFATQAAFAKAAPSTPTKEQTMDATEFNKIVDDALKPINDKIGALEAKASAAPATTKPADAPDLKAVVAEAMKPVTEQLASFRKTHDDTVKAQAKATVGKYVGRIGLAPQDTTAIEFWEKQVIADPATAEAMLQKLPARASGVRLTSTAAAAATSNEPEDLFLAKAKAYGKDNKLDDAEAIMQYGRTREGSELHSQFLEKMRSTTSRN